MSYILDALNKSEEEKKQHRTPGLNTIHQKPGNRNQGKIPLWALVVGGVVFVGFLGLIVWFVLLADTPQTADVTAPRPAKAQPIIRQPQLGEYVSTFEPTIANGTKDEATVTSIAGRIGAIRLQGQ